MISRIILSGFIVFFSVFTYDCNAKALLGEISKEDFRVQKPQVIDAQTNLPITGAAVALPTENLVTYTDNNGNFILQNDNSAPVILSVQKEGYRPFSMTLKDGKIKNNFQLKLEKNHSNSLVLTDSMMHLGDNSYSENSSGACLINSPCVGPSYSKDFQINDLKNNSKIYVTIGSVIGIDTIQAMKLGQNNLTSATSTPLEIFVNKKKIGELKINGDNQRIPIPKDILNKTAQNTLTIKTGINKSLIGDVDYDDVELMNLFIDVK